MARGALLFTNELLDDHHSIEDPVAFDSLLQDESYPDDISEVLRLNCARTVKPNLAHWQRSR